MDSDVLKLLPKKAFKLISVKDSIKIGAQLAKSIVDKKTYQAIIELRLKNLQLHDVTIVDSIPSSAANPQTQAEGEKILQIYFLQFFDQTQYVHIDFRMNHFAIEKNFLWLPSKLHHSFSEDFKQGIREIYIGFYINDPEKFEAGLKFLGILPPNISDNKKNEITKIFYDHFGEGKNENTQFHLKKLQDSFNKIFSYFLKEDIPLNPQFAVLGVMLATLYSSLEKIPYPLNVKQSFIEVYKKYN